MVFCSHHSCHEPGLSKAAQDSVPVVCARHSCLAVRWAGWLPGGSAWRGEQLSSAPPPSLPLLPPPQLWLPGPGGSEVNHSSVESLTISSWPLYLPPLLESCSSLCFLQRRLAYSFRQLLLLGSLSSLHTLPDFPLKRQESALPLPPHLLRPGLHLLRLQMTPSIRQ